MGIVLGGSGRLGIARFGAGSAALIKEIMAVESEHGLVQYLEAQTHIRQEGYIQAGRDRGLPFDAIHRSLRKARGDRMPANCEVAVATGKRLAAGLQQQELGLSVSIKGQIPIGAWTLHDAAHKRGLAFVQAACCHIESASPVVVFNVRGFSESDICRWFACDVCPVNPGSREDYRCIIRSGTDLLVQRHRELVSVDAMLLAAYGPADPVDLHSVYQRSPERTRYLRCDDDALAGRRVAPLVISAVGSNQSLRIRMLTSPVRHRTFLHHPLIADEHGEMVLTRDRMVEDAMGFVECAAQLAAGRVARSGAESSQLSDNAVGYHVSARTRRAGSQRCDFQTQAGTKGGARTRAGTASRRVRCAILTAGPGRRTWRSGRSFVRCRRNTPDNSTGRLLQND